MRLARRHIAAFAATLIWSGSAQAARPVDEGLRFARRACAGCHAIGASGRSPDPLAPTFRSLVARLGHDLEPRLGQLSAHGHRNMPPIYMTPDERRAVAAYIRAVSAERRIARSHAAAEQTCLEP